MPLVVSFGVPVAKMSGRGLAHTGGTIDKLESIKGYQVERTKEEFIQQVKENLYIKREDLIPYSFGGNKARKGLLFFKEIDKGGYDCVVTYGSSHSNHCRIIANMAAARKMKCYLISPREIQM